jgi:hypothetical protein
MLAASPLLSVRALSRALGCSTESAAGMLNELVRLDIVSGVTGMIGRGIRRLYGLRRLLPVRADTTAERRRSKGGPRGRPRKILVAPLSELSPEAEGVPLAPAEIVFQVSDLTPPAFDFEAFDRLVADTDEQLRHVHRLLAGLAAGARLPHPS